MSDSYELTGQIKVLNDTQTFPSGFTKREFVVEAYPGDYPQLIKLEAAKAGCDKLDAFRVGDQITVGFNLRGNEYGGKYYTSLQAWKFSKPGQDSQPAQQRASQPPQRQQDRDNGGSQGPDDFDDIPFGPFNPPM